MAKKHPRSGKPTGGGRVTPKGVRPDGRTGQSGGDQHTELGAPRPEPLRVEPAHGRRFGGPTGPTRAGHHHGQR
jgi:hypothetical protein